MALCAHWVKQGGLLEERMVWYKKGEIKEMLSK